MKKVTAEHEHACTPDVFWKLFFDQEFNRELYLKALEFEGFEVIEQTDTSRKARMRPKVNMPKAVMKLLGDKFAYVEEGTFDRDAGVWSYEVLPNTLQGKLTNRGKVRVVSAGEGRCKRIDEMTVEAKVFGLGGLIESSTEKEVAAGWRKAAAFTDDWLKRES